MKREAAKRIHEATNLAYWMEKPGWESGITALDHASHVLRALPFSVHDLQKTAYFKPDTILAVNGESVVARGSDDTVDKFMFRYPGRMSQQEFFGNVVHEVGAVTRHLGEVALQTDVSIKPADIFRLPALRHDAVAQTQPRLDLSRHVILDLERVEEDYAVPSRDRVAADLEAMVTGIHRMAEEDGYYPDIPPGSDNLRSALDDGSLTLIDVMPVYADGGRLINDGADALPGALEGLRTYEDYVGTYGG